MAANWLYIDTNFPSFTGQESNSEKITTIQNYLYMLVEQLRYTLFNLDTSNWNDTALSEYGETITDPIYVRIEDDEGNITQLQITAEGIATRVSNSEGDISQLQQTASSLTSQVSDAQSNISILQQTATSLTSQISTANGNISTLQQTATSLTSQISTAQGNISQLQQTASSLTSQIADANGNISQLQQTVDGFTLVATNGTDSSVLSLKSGGTTIASATINMSGMVTFTDLSQTGATTINGSNITTGQIDVDYLKLHGLMSVYQYGSSSTVGGYIGYGTGQNAYGDTTSGMRLMDATMKAAVRLTNDGARIQFARSSSKVSSVTCTAPENGSSKVSISASSIVESVEPTVSSDRRKKAEIRYDPEKYLAVLDGLRPCSFRYRDGDGRRHIGFIAQDVEDAMDAAAVAYDEFAPLEIDEDGEYSLRYGEFIPLLLAKIQKLEKRVEELEAKLAGGAS